jgi:hypothetical protein
VNISTEKSLIDILHLFTLKPQIMENENLPLKNIAAIEVETDFPVIAKKKNINDFFDAFEDTLSAPPVIFKKPEEGEICTTCSA